MALATRLSDCWTEKPKDKGCGDGTHPPSPDRPGKAVSDQTARRPALNTSVALGPFNEGGIRALEPVGCANSIALTSAPVAGHSNLFAPAASVSHDRVKLDGVRSDTCLSMLNVEEADAGDRCRAVEGREV